MSSGFGVSVRDITEVQDTYNHVVEQVGCSTASDTLACLRKVPANCLLAAAKTIPSESGNFPFLPSVDGVFVTTSPLQLPFRNKIADVPLITGTTCMAL